ncbi:hypothetical protein [Pseudomonas sp. R5(2019)]|uniref:hypothetical protein n=1 Tax=Pseudomonas sp. R5(2019) TaxID=2697566 RepID=UPI0014136776|nr:hypothetical protein [Pseudomonas sp. R5(2019)]NBA95499.1 hypothetical protein [Pseudomonas sp. R5(2019)]
MIAYPEFLPLPQRDGYGFQPVSPISRTQLANGRAIQRRKFRNVPTVATVSWLFSDAQAQLFEGWFEHILISGSLWFQCPLKTPLGMDEHRARFVDIYDGPNLVGVSQWRFTAKVELFKRPILDADWIITVPDYVAMTDIFDRAINREWPAG